MRWAAPRATGIFRDIDDPRRPPSPALLPHRGNSRRSLHERALAAIPGPPPTPTASRSLHPAPPPKPAPALRSVPVVAAYTGLAAIRACRLDVGAHCSFETPAYTIRTWGGKAGRRRHRTSQP